MSMAITRSKTTITKGEMLILAYSIRIDQLTLKMEISAMYAKEWKVKKPQLETKMYFSRPKDFLYATMMWKSA